MNDPPKMVYRSTDALDNSETISEEDSVNANDESDESEDGIDLGFDLDSEGDLNLNLEDESSDVMSEFAPDEMDEIDAAEFGEGDLDLSGDDLGLDDLLSDEDDDDLLDIQSLLNSDDEQLDIDEAVEDEEEADSGKKKKKKKKKENLNDPPKMVYRSTVKVEMKNKINIRLLVLVAVLFLTGCVGKESVQNIESPSETGAITEEQIESENEDSAEESHEAESEVTFINQDHSDLFSGLNGCAVIYDFDAEECYVHNVDQMDVQYSPLSTFKIVSTLMGLKSGVLENENSIMGYDGTIYPLDQWNSDLSLKEAFGSSCIWYFRKVIDAVGMKEVQQELDNLHYGNCDISEWNGSGRNPLDDLNGFWISSSLKISPLEQVKVMKSILDGESIYSDAEINTLKNVMLYDEINGYSIFGKTGTSGSEEGWYVGFAEKEQKKYGFAVHIISAEKDVAANGNEARKIVEKIFEK